MKCIFFCQFCFLTIFSRLSISIFFCHFIFRLRLLSPQTQRLFNQVTGDVVRRSRSLDRGYHEVCGDIICPSVIQGIDHIRDPRLNKGLAFTLEERQVLGIHGLQPARFKSQEEQLELCLISIRRYKESLNKYLYLVDLQVSTFFFPKTYKRKHRINDIELLFFSCYDYISTILYHLSLSPLTHNTISHNGVKNE